jgi:hypothetical protein
MSCPGCHDTPLPLYNESYCSTNPVILPPCVDGEPCEDVVPAECVVYTGDTITTFGIVDGDRLDSILHKLDVNSTSNNIIVADTSTVHLTGLVNGETTFTKTVVSTTNSTTLVLNNGTDITPGQPITGVNIDSDTKVLSITSSTLVLNKPVLGVVTNQTLTFTRSVGVGLVSNPIIATVKKSSSVTNGDNKIELLSDGLYVSPKIKTTSDDTIADYLGNKLIAGTNISITSSSNITHGKVLTIASTASTGPTIDVTDTATIDLTLTPGVGSAPSILSANLLLDSKTLVTPVITPGFSYKQADGVSNYNASLTTGYDNTDIKNPIVDIGAKVKIGDTSVVSNAGTYSWTVTDSATQAGPTTVSVNTNNGTTGITTTNNFSSVLPSISGTDSSPAYTEVITTNQIGTVTKTVTISKPNSGLMVSGTKVVSATGNEQKSASVSVRFKYKFYAGASNNTSLTGDQIRALDVKGFTDPGATITRTDVITSNTSRYYYFCFPTALTNVILGGALSVFANWDNLGNVNVTNDAGLVVSYIVFRSHDPNGYSSTSTLTFKL